MARTSILLPSPSVAEPTLQGRVTVTEGFTGVGSDSHYLVGTDEDEDIRRGQADVKKDGTFQLKSVVDGELRHHVLGAGEKLVCKSVRLGAQELIDKGLQLEAGGPGGRLEVVVSSASAQLEGSVSGHDGADHRSARADRSRTRDALQSIAFARREKTDQSGHFVCYWSGARHVSTAGADIRRRRGANSSLRSANHNLVRARSQDVVVDHRRASSRVAPAIEEIPAGVGFTI